MAPYKYKGAPRKIKKKKSIAKPPICTQSTNKTSDIPGLISAVLRVQYWSTLLEIHLKIKTIFA